MPSIKEMQAAQRAWAEQQVAAGQAAQAATQAAQAGQAADAQAYYESIANDPNRTPEERAHAAAAARNLQQQGAGEWGEAYAARQEQYESRADQEALQEELWARMRGERESVAQQQLAASTAENIRAQQSAASSAGAGGFGEALANKQAAFGAAQARQQAGGQAALLRAQESATDTAMLADMANTQRGQDIGRQQTENDLVLGIKTEDAQRQAAKQASEDAASDRRWALAGGALQAGATIGGVALLGPAGGAGGYAASKALTGDPKAGSDPKLKRDITPAWGQSDWLDQVQPVTYRYKDSELQSTGGRMDDSGTPLHWADETPKQGKYLGVLTSDLEKTPEGAQMVSDTPKGKAIDPATSIGVLTAALADINRRLDAMEARKR